MHTVRAHLRVRPRAVRELYLLPALADSPLAQLARQAAVPVRYEPMPFFQMFTQGGVHQGVAALLDPFAYSSLADIVSKDAHCVLVLDGILDPRNLGALLRTAEAAGVGGVILPADRSAQLSPLVEKTAAGATASLSLCQVPNLARALTTLRDAGYWLVGLAPEATHTVYNLPRLPKIALLLGGEEKGLRALTRQQCDYLIAIPMQGAIESLNVSVAGAVALYEFLRRSLRGNGSGSD